MKKDPVSKYEYGPMEWRSNDLEGVREAKDVNSKRVRRTRNSCCVHPLGECCICKKCRRVTNAIRIAFLRQRIFGEEES